MIRALGLGKLSLVIIDRILVSGIIYANQWVSYDNLEVTDFL